MKRNLSESIHTAAVIVLGIFFWGGAISQARADSAPPINTQDSETIQRMLRKIATENLEKLKAIPIGPFEINGASIDVMRVRLEETYDIQGIGRDTVELYGWIAVMHDTPRSIAGKSTPDWDDAVTPTEFVGMHLLGHSPVFGNVEVNLDERQRVLGEVGALYVPFVAQVSADLSYRELRGISPEGGPAYAQRLMPAEYRWSHGDAVMPIDNKSKKGDEADIRQVVIEVLYAINAKDAKAMISHYSDAPDAVFFGPNVSNEKQGEGRERYVQHLESIFQNIKSIKATPNRDLRIKVLGATAVATVTGKNQVVDVKDRSGESPWRWTLQLERRQDGWKISHEHLSFISSKIAPERNFSIQDRGVCCLAQVSVKIRLPDLKIEMATASPVQWYSEVTTIPPVGHTASVSLASTNLIIGARTVGILESVVVRFREVVARETLLGSPRDSHSRSNIGRVMTPSDSLLAHSGLR
jgi:ketosteroid isomerase-like protein